MPIAFLDRLCPDNIFVDAPLAGAPLNNLVSRPGKVACDARLISILVQITAGQTAALSVNVGVVGCRVVKARLPGRAPHLGGAVALAGQGAARRKRGEVSIAGRGRRIRASVATSAAAQHHLNLTDGSDADNRKSHAAQTALSVASRAESHCRLVDRIQTVQVRAHACPGKAIRNGCSPAFLPEIDTG